MKDKLINKFNTSASVNKAAVKARYSAVINKLDQGIKWLGSSF